MFIFLKQARAVIIFSLQEDEMTVKRLTTSLEPNKKTSLLLKNYVYLAPKWICKLLCILIWNIQFCFRLFWRKNEKWSLNYWHSHLTEMRKLSFIRTFDALGAKWIWKFRSCDFSVCVYRRSRTLIKFTSAVLLKTCFGSSTDK